MPSNRQIAATLDRLADLMELDGANIYKIVAHRKAAHRIAESNFSIEALADEGRLTELPDIGEKIAAKVEEMVTTGRIAELDEYSRKFPPDLVDLQRVQGIGPKTTRKVWEELGVSSLDELEAAARAGQVAGLPGMGKKTEANLIKAIERLRERSGRMPLGEVLPVAEEAAAALSRLPQSHHVTLAGSVRRMKETVKDVDIIATAADPRELTRAFANLPMVAEVIAAGPTKCSIRTHTDLQMDLRVAPDQNYGSLLQHFTGSREHNIALREMAIGQGLKVSEYGIEETASGNIHACGTEEEVYRRLGLDFIPPELRENAGELEAAATGRLPELITEPDIKGDLHVHSDWSDGRGTIRDMADSARRRGCEYIAISDHSQSLAVAGGLTPARLERQLKEIGKINAGADGFHIFTGMEVDIKADGSLDLPDDSLEALDFVTVSIHSGFTQERRQIMARLTAAMEKPFVRSIGHPTGRLISRRDAYEVDVDELIATAARTGTALEINSHYWRLDLCDLHARAAQEAGVRLVINSDAHTPGDAGNLRLGVATARRGWIRRETVLNTLSVTELSRVLESPKGT
ncbi:DNA polymerase/3'-5' exonuclease PolX [bacterium BMS3Abin01]|nr:DNA polymerase/3'-5' exonuclease PolX [bacterium BMS3Abin01]